MAEDLMRGVVRLPEVGALDGVDAEVESIDAGAGARAFGEALHMEGICKPGVVVEPNSESMIRVLARLVRRA